MTIIYCH